MVTIYQSFESLDADVVQVTTGRCPNCFNKYEKQKRMEVAICFTHLRHAIDCCDEATSKQGLQNLQRPTKYHPAVSLILL